MPQTPTNYVGERAAAGHDRFFLLSPELQAVIRFSGRILRCNPAWQTQLDYAPAGLEGRNLAELMHPDDLFPITALLQTGILAGESVHHFEARLRHADGSYRTLAWETVSVPQEANIYGFARDVSALRRAESELGFNQRLMQQLLANTPILINVKDLDDRFLYVSRRMAEASGIAVENLRGRRARDVLPAGSIPPMLEHERFVRERLQPSTYLDTVSYDGVTHEFLTVKFPIVSDSGALEAIGTIATEATELLRVEAELREAQERFHQAFDNSAIGMALVALDGRWLQVNRALCELLGYAPEELLRLDFQAITHEQDIERDITLLDRLIEGDTESYSIEKRYLARDGHAIWALLSVSAVRDGNGGIRYFVNQIQDISERKRIQEQLQRSNDDLSQAVVGLRRYEDELLRIHELSQQLMVSVDRDQAYRVLHDTMGRLIPGQSWFLAIADAEHGTLRPVVGSNELLPPEHDFAASDCRALRHRRTHSHRASEPGEACSHIGGDDRLGSCCIPLLLDDRPAGLLFVGGLGSAAEAERVRRPLEIAAGVINTGLANLDLRLSLAEQATRDKLTGLHNRHHLELVLPVEFERAERRGVPICLALLDIDHFKRINDERGHDAGDAVLHAIADYLRNTLRVTDGVFRYGGDELLLILSEAEPAGVKQRLEQLRDGIANLRIRIAGLQLPMQTVSIGAAMSVPWSSDMDRLVRGADQALYRAKQAGRNRVELADAIDESDTG